MIIRRATTIRSRRSQSFVEPPQDWVAYGFHGSRVEEIRKMERGLLGECVRREQNIEWKRKELPRDAATTLLLEAVALAGTHGF